MKGPLIQLWKALETANKAVERAVKLVKDVRESMAKAVPAQGGLSSVNSELLDSWSVRQPQPSRV